MLRFSKMSPKHGSANAVQLTSFNHINGDSSTTSQGDPSSGVQQNRAAIQSSSKAEILGPTGTVRGYKNIIRDRKKVLRHSIVGETLEVGQRNSCESKQIRLWLIIYANSLIYPCDMKCRACDISDVVFCLIFIQESEEGKIVVYTTSMGGIRSKVKECAYIRKLFDNLGLKVDERDIFMHKDYQSELDMRLAIQNASVPHVFVNGDSLGVRKPVKYILPATSRPRR